MKVTIDINVPSGYEFVRYGLPKAGETFLSRNGYIFTANVDYTDISHFIIKNLKPRRRVFECVSEEPREVRKDEIYQDHDGDLITYKFRGGTIGKYKIWKEVDVDNCPSEPPKTKRTFTLNGVELPCPKKDGEYGKDYTFDISGEIFGFDKQKDRDIVHDEIIKLLNGARYK